MAACILLGALSGVMEAEVERIWQFMIPFAAVAAAPLASRRAVTWGIVAGVAMAYVVELRWDTTFSGVRQPLRAATTRACCRLADSRASR